MFTVGTYCTLDGTTPVTVIATCTTYRDGQVVTTAKPVVWVAPVQGGPITRLVGNQTYRLAVA